MIAERLLLFWISKEQEYIKQESLIAREANRGKLWMVKDPFSPLKQPEWISISVKRGRDCNCNEVNRLNALASLIEDKESRFFSLKIPLCLEKQ